MDCLISFSIILNLILMAMQFSFFAGEKQTGSKQFIMKEMGSAFCISDSKMDA